MNKLPYAMLKDDGTPINQESPCLLRTLTPAGGAQVREYADVTNAATVGTIEIGKSFNVAVNTTTGIWAGRDTTGECWLEKWTDTGALKEYWYAAPATAGVVPTWVKTHSVDVTTGKTIVAAATSQTQAVNGSQLFGFRNKIINGNFDIWQRGTTPVTTSGVYGPADRWLVGVEGTTFSAAQGTLTSSDALFSSGGAQYYTEITVNSVAGAGNLCNFGQRLEGVSSLAGKAVTLSFWAKAAVGSPSIGIEISQNFGSGGSASTLGVGQAQVLSTTWTKYTKTITVPDISGKTIGTSSYTGLTIWLDAGSTYDSRSGAIGQSSKVISIAQVQLEEGSLATPFEQRPIGTELELCQRYYETGHTYYEFGTATNNYIRSISNYSVAKRVISTISFTDAAGNVNKITEMRNTSSTDNITPTAISMFATTEGFTTSHIATGLYGYRFYWFADAEL